MPSQVQAGERNGAARARGALDDASRRLVHPLAGAPQRSAAARATASAASSQATGRPSSRASGAERSARRVAAGDPRDHRLIVREQDAAVLQQRAVLAELGAARHLAVARP